MARRPVKTLDIRISTHIQAEAGRVYRALTSARELCVWWVDKAETEARSMGRFRLVWPSHDRKKNIEATGVFVDLEREKKVAWIWDDASRPSGLPALVSFFIEEGESGCEVILVHAGFSAAASKRRMLEGFRVIWEDVISKLKLYLESEKICKGELLTLSDVELLAKADRR
jgi:uncharacterized protein YndB with AHSA1/START domain